MRAVARTNAEMNARVGFLRLVSGDRLEDVAYQGAIFLVRRAAFVLRHAFRVATLSEVGSRAANVE